MHDISDDNLALLIKKIISKTGGIYIAIKILHMRLHGLSNPEGKYSIKLASVGREILSKYKFPKEKRENNAQDYDLSQIINVFLKGKDGKAAAKKLCNNLAKAIKENLISSYDYSQVINSLAQVQPIEFLNTFLDKNNIEPYQRYRMFSDNFQSRENPLYQISERDIIAWCNIDPKLRYPIIAELMQFFSTNTETGELQWDSIAHSFFEQAPNLAPVLKHIAGKMRPTSWSGSRADIIQKRITLFQKLYEHSNKEISTWAKAKYIELQELIKKEREWEGKQNQERDESFE